MNGTAAGQARIACTATLYEPPLTNDRSATALGRQFGGMKGALGGVAINSDGSNINPVALALLNFKMPDGSFLIPTPQTVDPSKPFTSSGFSAFTKPCDFCEDQGLGNLDYRHFGEEPTRRAILYRRERSVGNFPGRRLEPSG